MFIKILLSLSIVLFVTISFGMQEQKEADEILEFIKKNTNKKLSTEIMDDFVKKFQSSNDPRVVKIRNNAWIVQCCKLCIAEAPFLNKNLNKK